MKFKKNLNQLKKIQLVLPIIILIISISYVSSAYQNSFNEAIFNENNVYEHINELSSPRYNGRLAGSKGNKLAIKYVENYFKDLGIEPSGENDTYYQRFDSIVPQIDSDPIFFIKDGNGKIVEEFEMYKDYRLYTYSVGGGGDIEGEILFAGRYLNKIRPELIKDRIVVMGGYSLRPKDIDYVLANGGKGLLFTPTFSSGKTRNTFIMKAIGRGGKNGKTLLLGALGKKAYGQLRKRANYYLIEKEYKNFNYTEIEDVPKLAGLIKGVKIKCNIDFPIVESMNVLGKIQGKKKNGGYIIIGAHLDHVGSGTNGKFFPGALDNASGIGMMLELARISKLQKNLPQKTIIFAAWNAEENGINGSKYYVDNPIYPLKKTQVINIDCIGGVNAREVIIESDIEVGNLIKSKMYQYAEDKDINAKEYTGATGSDHQPFIEAGVPAVSIVDSMFNIHTYNDTIDNVSKENLRNAGLILTSYIKRDVFKDTLPDYLNKVEISLIILFILVIFVIYILFSLNKSNPSLKILFLSIEDIYYSSAFNLISKIFYFITPIFIILFSLIFIASLPPNFDFKFNNVGISTNLSIYLTVKESILYIRNFFLNGFGTTSNNIEVIDILLTSLWRSVKLISMTLVISFVLGIFKGIFDSYRDERKSGLRTVGTLVALSLPDVLIVLCSMMLTIYVANNDVLAKLVDPSNLRGFIMPLLSISIIPIVYISRITLIFIREELAKGYITAAKAKGMSKLRIYINHVFSGVAFKVIDSIPTLMTIIISNLIIVEYLFNYKGIAFNLYRFYKADDITSFIGLSLALGGMYVVFILLSRTISKALNPMKREKTS